MSRYIHLNPVHIADAGKLTITQRQAALRDYRWSSYRAMIGLAEAEEWLATAATLSHWGSGLREQQNGYARFVEEGLIEEVKDPAEEAKAQSILGRDRFIDRLQRILRQRGKKNLESERARRQLTTDSVETVVRRVARAYRVTPEELQKVRKGPGGNEARQVAMWLTRDRCSAAVTAREIGKARGGVSGSAVVMAHARLSRRLHRDKWLKRMVDRLP